ncbi:hypothetical protein [Paracoccus marinaquae]|uniref:Uncharacterized protein n=1 Tax=Paracoccus marinaquae TaxID=2841926 RepID=A0ABS6AMF9_9RHOB|nr:hypothetical protein [Paracoccus marinaquae]MBU3031786.1 hypothetical protein [Paracoccus marinaquae]
MARFPIFGIAVDRKPAFARDDVLSHDGWSDFEKDLTELDATITDIYISGSDPTLQVRAHDGVNWTVELGGRSRNRDAGLLDAKPIPGDKVTVLGRRTHHFGETRIKAMQLTIGDVGYDLYPELRDAS